MPRKNNDASIFRWPSLKLDSSTAALNGSCSDQSNEISDSTMGWATDPPRNGLQRWLYHQPWMGLGLAVGLGVIVGIWVKR